MNPVFQTGLKASRLFGDVFKGSMKGEHLFIDFSLFTPVVSCFC